jgi:hypothetical protein
MPQGDYAPYSPNVEVPQPGEDALVDKILESVERLNTETFEQYRHAVRSAHAKSHGVLKGALTAYPDLAPHLRQGIFAEPRTYPVIVRLSTAPGAIQSDRVPSNCGMAIKVLGVDGAKADPGDMTRNQDILLVNSPVYFGGTAAYLQAQQMIEKSAKSPEALLEAVEAMARGAKEMLLAIGVTPPVLLRALAAPGNHILGETFHSMAALRFGAFIAKLRAAPLSESVRRLTGVAAHDSESVLRDRVVAFFQTETAEYELRAQLCTDLSRMPVEDASVEWRDDLSPPQPVAKITLPPQEAYSPARRVYADDILSFTAWRGLNAHRPLGSIMRLRRKVYEASSRFRHEMNARAPMEPSDIAELPD